MLQYILMANSIIYKENNYAVGDTISISYIIREGTKERQQLFQGILLQIRGADEANRMITVRKVSKTGIGVERIIPLSSPFIGDIKLVKRSSFTKSKLYFVRELSESQLRHKLYNQKKLRAQGVATK